MITILAIGPHTFKIRCTSEAEIIENVYRCFKLVQSDEVASGFTKDQLLAMSDTSAREIISQWKIREQEKREGKTIWQSQQEQLRQQGIIQIIPLNDSYTG